MVFATNLGFPRIGANRELKRLVENFWNKKVDEKALLTGAKNLRAEHWDIQKKAGVAHIPCNDFAFYDQVLDHIFLFGAIPAKYQGIPNAMDQYFAMGRGLQDAEKKVDVPAMEMKKWFDTNYHYIVPELSPATAFKLNSTKPLDEFNEAKALGIIARPVLIGPVSFLLLGKVSKDSPAGFKTLDLLDTLLPVYVDLLTKLAEAGAEWIQLDEPCVVFDLPTSYKAFFTKAYEALAKTNIKILVATYFGRLAENLDFLTELPVAGLHLDLIRAPEELERALTKLPASMTLSLGVINGRNIWKADLAAAIATVNKAVAKLGKDRVMVAPSCSLLHSPHSLESEKKMDAEIKSWMSFAVDKLSEIVVVAKAINDGPAAVKAELDANKKCVESRKTSKLIHNAEVQAEMIKISPDMMKRKNVFPLRVKAQQKELNLPSFPTTTVGSFPQTKEVRVARQKFKKGEFTLEQYNDFINEEMKKCVKFQEDVGLDVLVHGEFERNDMVEYFGENLKGYVFSENGWVQSYGSRCVKPPIIYGDVSRPKPMTVETSVYAQSLTTKPMKGMLTGPVTMLQWSFVRDDQPRKDTTYQIALALRKEVTDLEKAGIRVIQIDEPAIREGLPLRRSDWSVYLDWAVKSFLISSTGVNDTTQIHTHMCYSDFNDIFEAIQALDADCITIENSKSDLKLLKAFEKYGYTNGIGPGLYDIHSPRVPPYEEMKERVEAIIKDIKKELVWINPDCGLKTRGWPETEEALKNMCNVAKELRKSFGKAIIYGNVAAVETAPVVSA